MIEYSEIKKKIEIKIGSIKNNDLAYLTHYLQNQQNEVAKNYKKQVINYIALFEIDKVSFNDLVPIKWNVPFPPPQNHKFTFIDLFAGIGGFRIALQKLGGKCVFSSEIDAAAKSTYEANFGEYPFGDIKEFTKPEVSDEELDKLIPDHDVLAAGFPCQPFSRAGVSARNYLGQDHGFNDLDRGSLFFDIVRIASIKNLKFYF